MDGYSSKRAGRGSGLAFRDASNHDDQSVHCNRLVCSNSQNFVKAPQVRKLDKSKSSSSSGTNSKRIVGSSSRAYTSMNNIRTQDSSSHSGMLSAESNIMQLDKVNTEPSSSTARVRVKFTAGKDAESSVVDDSNNALEEVNSYNVRSSTKSQKQIYRQYGQGNQGASLGSPSRPSFGPRNTGQAAKITSFGRGSNANRSSLMSHSNGYGLRSLGCTSISDALPPGCSSRGPSQNGRTEVEKRRNHDGAYSYAKGKSTSASSSSGSSGNRKNSLASRSLSLSERPSQPTSRRTRYWLPSRNGVTSVRTRRSINDDSRSRISELDNSGSNYESPLLISNLPQGDVSVSETSSSLLQQSVPEHLAIGQSSSIRLGNRNEIVRNSPLPHQQDGSARQINGFSVNRDGYRHYNRDGIAEVLLALERIEQDEELTYEQLLILETNLFLSGLGLRDQHRDMRLDIDNMSYEELLALGDKMGTVSTGLTEEQLSNCLKRSFYKPPASPNLRIGCGGDNVKCSICQEEYVEEDELGMLGCDHQYHLVCVQQWLRLKNWCPICKSPASSGDSSF